MGLSHQGIYLHVTIPFSLSSHGYRNFSKGQYCLLSIFFPYFQPSVPAYLQCKCLSGRVSVCNCDLMSRDHVMCHITGDNFRSAVSFLNSFTIIAVSLLRSVCSASSLSHKGLLLYFLISAAGSPGPDRGSIPCQLPQTQCFHSQNL